MELLSHKTLLESISLFHIVKTTGKYEKLIPTTLELQPEILLAKCD